MSCIFKVNDSYYSSLCASTCVKEANDYIKEKCGVSLGEISKSIHVYIQLYSIYASISHYVVLIQFALKTQETSIIALHTLKLSQPTSNLTTFCMDTVPTRTAMIPHAMLPSKMYVNTIHITVNFEHPPKLYYITCLTLIVLKTPKLNLIAIAFLACPVNIYLQHTHTANLLR